MVNKPHNFVHTSGRRSKSEWLLWVLVGLALLSLIADIIVVKGGWKSIFLGGG